MKKINLIFAILLSFCGFSQTWHTYHYSSFTEGSLVFNDLSNGSRHFEINPYDNSMWFARNGYFQRVSPEGESEMLSYFTNPMFSPTANFCGFGFSENYSYVLDCYHGVYRLTDTGWEESFTLQDANGITVDELDTIWITRPADNAIQWHNGSSSTLPFTLTRLQPKDGIMWACSSGFYNGGLLFKIDNLDQIEFFGPANSLRMDNGNQDFKFSPTTDTLYVAGYKGLSLMYNEVFFDSIAPDNTTNMPAGMIYDFEFDENNNIWALFGNDFDEFTSLAHYDQVTKNWDLIYDTSNSPLDFNVYQSIEMDNMGNLWVASLQFLYLLQLNDVPFWLNTDQLKLEFQLEIFPNPSNTEVTINQTEGSPVKSMKIIDTQGKVFFSGAIQKSISVENYPSGSYNIQLLGEFNEVLGQQKLIVH